MVATDTTNARPVKDYTRQIRANVYGLWSGELQVFDFVDSMLLGIERYYRRAWIEGAKVCGIKEDELTAEEIKALYTEINNELPYLIRFAQDIQNNSKANKQKFTPLMKRATLWVNRYNSVKNHARLMACKNKKLKWVLNPLKESCKTCAKLDGKVKRQATWEQMGLRPQNAPNPLLECGGWKCGCTFVVTDEPLTKGRMPSVP
jgi:hypothetical protein